MLAACLLVLLELVASASTAAWYDPFDYNNGFQDNMDQFWNNFNLKMKHLDKKIETFIKRAKIRAPSSQIIGDEYTITIYLTGFNKDDIVVYAKKGNLVIEAIHNVAGEPVRNYLGVRSLPDFVDEKGSWSYNNDNLKIVFPIKQRGSDDTNEPTLSYVGKENDKASESKDPDENVMRSDLENSYDGDKSQTVFDPSK